MRKLISLSLSRPVATTMLFVSIIILGLISVRTMTVRLLPDISYPKILVLTRYIGLPPEDVRKNLTMPLEDGFSSLKGLRKSSSISRNSLSIITLEFHWGTDSQEALTYTKEAVDRIYTTLPEQSEKPMVFPYNPDDAPLCVVGIFPKEGRSLALARRLAEREVKTRLQQLSGVGSISLKGGVTEEVTIEMDPSQMTTAGLTPQSIASHIQNYNSEIPAGSLEFGSMEYIIKTDARFEHIDQIGELLVPTKSRMSIPLEQIAEITLEDAEQTSLFFHNKKEGVSLTIRTTPEGNPISTAKRVQDEIIWLKDYFQRDIDIELLQDNSVYISSTLQDLLLAGLIGAAAAFVILFIFLRNIKSALLLTITIPVSLISAVFGLSLTGRTINLMSMGGLILGIGMVVDNSVIIIENLLKKSKKGTIDETANLVYEMSRSSLGSTLTSLVVFIPVIFIPGLLGALFKDMALAVCFALIASYFISITFIPVLYRYSKISPKSHGKLHIETFYSKMLKFSLKRPILIIISSIIVIAAGSLAFIRIPKVFMEEQNQSAIYGRFVLPSGSSIDYIKSTAHSLVGKTLHANLIDTVIVQAGGELADPFYLADPRGGKETIELFVSFKENNQLTLDKQMNYVRNLIDSDIGDLYLSSPKNALTTLLSSGESATYRITGITYEEAKEKTDLFLDKYSIESDDYRLLPGGNREYIELIPRYDTMAQYRLSPYQLSMTTGSSFQGMPAGMFDYNGEDIPIKVLLTENARQNLDDLDNLRLLLQEGENRSLPVNYVAERKMKTTPAFLLRSNRQDEIVLDLFKPNKERNSYLLNIATQDQQEIFRGNQFDLYIAFFLAIFLIFVLLSSQFNSFSLPVRLMSILPIALFALSIGLYVSHNSFGLNAILGGLVLLGLTINNAIILFETYEQRCTITHHYILNIYKGSISRVRPILITTLTTITAMIPVAIDPLGEKAQSTLAVSIIWGLMGATLLTLFIIPPLFIPFYKKRYEKK